MLKYFIYVLCCIFILVFVSCSHFSKKQTSKLYFNKQFEDTIFIDKKNLTLCFFKLSTFVSNPHVIEWTITAEPSPKTKNIERRKRQSSKQVAECSQYYMMHLFFKHNRKIIQERTSILLRQWLTLVKNATEVFSSFDKEQNKKVVFQIKYKNIYNLIHQDNIPDE